MAFFVAVSQPGFLLPFLLYIVILFGINTVMKITNIVVFGAGSAGSGVLLNIICAHPELTYSVVDFDIVELRNINPGTQPYGKGDINRPKVQALQRIVKTTRDKSIVAHNVKIESREDIEKYASPKGSTLIIDAFDNASSRNLFIGLKGCNVLHVGFSAGLTGEAAWDSVYSKMTESKSEKSIDVCELHLAKPFISGLTAIAALVAIKFIETGEKTNAYFDSKMKMFTF